MLWQSNCNTCRSKQGKAGASRSRVIYLEGKNQSCHIEEHFGLPEACKDVVLVLDLPGVELIKYLQTEQAVNSSVARHAPTAVCNIAVKSIYGAFMPYQYFRSHAGEILITTLSRDSTTLHSSSRDHQQL